MRTQLAGAAAHATDHVVDGIRLHVTTYGSPGDGLDRAPAVLLLHGFPTSSQLWRVGNRVCLRPAFCCVAGYSPLERPACA